MAIFAMGQNNMDGVGNLGCDTTADVPNLPAFAESNRLKAGSTCLCKYHAFHCRGKASPSVSTYIPPRRSMAFLQWKSTSSMDSGRLRRTNMLSFPERTVIIL